MSKQSTEPKNQQPNQQPKKKELEAKWGKDVIKAGYTVIPNVLLEHQHQIGLDATDLAILAQIVRFWWYEDNLPHPGKVRLATHLGVHSRTVQRRIARMERAGLLERIERHTKGAQRSNFYRLTGLIERAQHYAQQSLEAQEETKRKRAKARRRGVRKSSQKGSSHE